MTMNDVICSFQTCQNVVDHSRVQHVHSHSSYPPWNEDTEESQERADYVKGNGQRGYMLHNAIGELNNYRGDNSEPSESPDIIALLEYQVNCMLAFSMTRNFS